MQHSVCPECGERIGGSDHTLTQSNRHDMELEEISRQQGAQRSPWSWGV